MKKILKALGIKYVHCFPVWGIIKHGYQADFYVEKYKLIIEVDGKYWHKYPHGLPVDKIRNAELKKKKYKVIRFWENEFNLRSVRKQINKIALE